VGLPYNTLHGMEKNMPMQTLDINRQIMSVGKTRSRGIYETLSSEL